MTVGWSGENGALSWTIPLLGSALLVTNVLLLVIFSPLPDGEGADLVLGGGFAALVLAFGLWMVSGRSGISSELYPRIINWCLGGMGLFAAIVLTLRLASGDNGAGWEILTSLSLAVNIGATVGVLIGSNEARAIQSTREAERERLRSEQKETERAQLDYLNSFLRHEVLNDINHVMGYSELAIQESPNHSAVRDHLDVVSERATNIATTIEDAKSLVEATMGDPDLRSTDLTQVLANEITTFCECNPEVHVAADIPNGLSVRCNEMLSRVFSNLLRNAAEHNDSDDPQVTVVAAQLNGTVVVHVIDNGPGVPPAEQTKLFERGDGNHGIGLYLVRNIVDRYDGNIALTETGEYGSTFTVRLPATETSATVQRNQPAKPSSP